MKTEKRRVTYQQNHSRVFPEKGGCDFHIKRHGHAVYSVVGEPDPFTQHRNFQHTRQRPDPRNLLRENPPTKFPTEDTMGPTSPGLAGNQEVAVNVLRILRELTSSLEFQPPHPEEGLPSAQTPPKSVIWTHRISERGTCGLLFLSSQSYWFACFSLGLFLF